MADSAGKAKARTVEWVRERLRAEMSSASGALSPQCRDEESILSVVSNRLNVTGADIRACLAPPGFKLYRGKVGEWRELEPGQWRLDVPGGPRGDASITVAMIGGGERNVFVTVHDGATSEVRLTAAEFDALQKLKVTHG